MYAAIALGIDIGDPHQLERNPQTLAQHLPLTLEELDHPRPDRTKADQADTYRPLHRTALPRV